MSAVSTKMGRVQIFSWYSVHPGGTPSTLSEPAVNKLYPWQYSNWAGGIPGNTVPRKDVSLVIQYLRRMYPWQYSTWAGGIPGIPPLNSAVQTSRCPVLWGLGTWHTHSRSACGKAVTYEMGK